MYSIQPVRTLQRAQRASIRKVNLLTLYRKAAAIYFKTRTKGTVRTQVGAVPAVQHTGLQVSQCYIGERMSCFDCQHFEQVH